MDPIVKWLKQELLAYIDSGVSDDDCEHAVSVSHCNILRWFDALDRLSAQQREPVVRVKELEWSEEPPYHIARMRIGFYSVEYIESDDGGYFDLRGSLSRGNYRTLGDAKSAAQADYEQRIMAAIEIQSSDGGVEGHATASGSGPLPDPILGTDTVGRQQELKRTAGIKPGPSEAIADVSVDELALVLDRLVNAPALKGVRELVAGWNGENRPEGPYKDRHPNRLGATLPKTNCGAVYELDEAMQSARAILDRLAGGRR